MKVFFLIQFLLFSSWSFTQNQSGEILYNITFGLPKESDKSNGALDSFRKDMEKAASKLSFKLIFDGKESLFFSVKNLSMDDKDFNSKMVKSIFGAEKIFYTDISRKEYIEQKKFLGKSFLITTSFDKVSWELTNETKKISGYECYKAVGSRESVGKDFKVNTLETYAWYCPEIPLNFGPFEAVGLPGLVLEFNLKGHSFVAQNINFDKKVIVKKPQKGESISKNDFDNMILKRAKKETSN